MSKFIVEKMQKKCIFLTKNAEILKNDYYENAKRTINGVFGGFRLLDP